MMRGKKIYTFGQHSSSDVWLLCKTQSYKVTQPGLELTTFQLLPSQGWDHTWYCHAWPSILIWSYNSNSITHEEMENYCRRESHDFSPSAILGEWVLTVSCQETRPHVEVSDHRELGVLPCAQLSHGDLVSLPPLWKDQKGSLVWSPHSFRPVVPYRAVPTSAHDYIWLAQLLALALGAPQIH